MIWAILLPSMWVWWQWRKYRLNHDILTWRIGEAFPVIAPPAWRVIAARSVVGALVGFYVGLIAAVAFGNVLVHSSLSEYVVSPWMFLFAFRPEN